MLGQFQQQVKMFKIIQFYLNLMSSFWGVSYKKQLPITWLIKLFD